MECVLSWCVVMLCYLSIQECAALRGHTSITLPSPAPAEPCLAMPSRALSLPCRAMPSRALPGRALSLPCPCPAPSLALTCPA